MSLKVGLLRDLISHNPDVQTLGYWNEGQEATSYLQSDRRVRITYPTLPLDAAIDRRDIFDYEDPLLLKRDTLSFTSAIQDLGRQVDEGFKYIIAAPMHVHDAAHGAYREKIHCAIHDIEASYPRFKAGDYKIFYTAQEISINPHYDPGDRILLQLKGTKKVRMLPSRYLLDVDSYPVSHVADRNLIATDIADNCKTRPFIQEFVLNEGDALLMPAYWTHHIETESESLTLTLTDYSALADICRGMGVQAAVANEELRPVCIQHTRSLVDVWILQSFGAHRLKDFHSKWLNGFYPDGFLKDAPGSQLYHSLLSTFNMIRHLYSADVNKFFMEHSNTYRALIA